jgi:hypothetical protein
VDDRRRNDRIDAHDVGLQVINGVDGEKLGVIGNLSKGGMMLISSRQLYTDGILQLTIQTPSDLDCGPISLGVKILWCTPANSPEEYWAGLETIDIGASEDASLDQLLNYLAN